MLEVLETFTDFFKGIFSIIGDFVTSFLDLMYLIFVQLPVYLYKFIDTLPGFFKYGFKALIVSIIAILFLKLVSMFLLRG